MRPRVFPAEDDRLLTVHCLTDARFNEAAGIPRGRQGTTRQYRPRGGCFNEAAGIPRGRHQGLCFPRRLSGCCFNEAAGIPRGRRAASTTTSNARLASMRPRVFPAEDRRRVAEAHGVAPRFNEAAGIPRGRRSRGEASRGRPWASMRPRVFPAEDGEHQAQAGRTDGASMRPRVFPAEDVHGFARKLAESCASMRPRVFPAEDQRRPAQGRQATTRFNEAAGIPRGRPRKQRRHVAHGDVASMRPRVFPAEDVADAAAVAPSPSALQ